MNTTELLVFRRSYRFVRFASAACLGRAKEIENAERSVTGGGIHVYGQCNFSKLPTFTDKEGEVRLDKQFYQKNSAADLELYVGGITNRFAVYTGNTIEDMPLRERTAAVLTTLDKNMRRNAQPFFHNGRLHSTGEPMPREHEMSLWMRCAVVTASTSFVAAELVLAWRFLGPHNGATAFLFCFLPTSWAPCVKRAINIRLPSQLYNLQAWETNKRVYERLGIRTFRHMLRMPVIRSLNQDIPRQFRERHYEEAEREMRFAEASHVLASIVALLAIAYALTQRWWDTAGSLVVCNTIVNAYPVMLQRYNRGRLLRVMAMQGASRNPSGHQGT